MHIVAPEVGECVAICIQTMIQYCVQLSSDHSATVNMTAG